MNGKPSDGGVPHGQLLAELSEAVTRRENAEDLRSAVIDAVGAEGFVETAKTIQMFNMVDRIADATGIPLDDGTRTITGELRSELGLDELAGASNRRPA